MGYEARVRKNRKCKTCKKVVRVTATEFRDHAELCRRVEAINMILEPSIVVPQPGDTLRPRRVPGVVR